MASNRNRKVREREIIYDHVVDELVCRFRRRINLKIDETHRYQAFLSHSKTEFHPNPSYIYIGGYHHLCSSDQYHCHSYRGCLKNLTIDQQSVNLINDEINSNRLLKQCHDSNLLSVF